MQLGAKNAVGFDIAENIIEQAIDTAEKAGMDNAVLSHAIYWRFLKHITVSLILFCLPLER